MAAKIEFSVQALKEMKRAGIDLNGVLETIKAPDSLQKIVPDSKLQGDWPIVSFYMKRSDQDGETQFLLVQALKSGGMITATAVWQVYADDIGISETAGALAVFSAFVNKYGIHLKTPHGLTKLVKYDVITSQTSVKSGRVQQNFMLPEGILNSDDCRVTIKPEIGIVKWSRQLSVKMYVAMMYTVNITNYLHDLSLHSLQTS